MDYRALLADQDRKANEDYWEYRDDPVAKVNPDDRVRWATADNPVRPASPDWDRKVNEERTDSRAPQDDQAYPA